MVHTLCPFDSSIVNQSIEQKQSIDTLQNTFHAHYFRSNLSHKITRAEPKTEMSTTIPVERVDVEDVTPTITGPAAVPATTTTPLAGRNTGIDVRETEVPEEVPPMSEDPNLLDGVTIAWSLFMLLAVSTFPFFSLVVVCIEGQNNLQYLLGGIAVSIYALEFFFMIPLVCINNTWSFYSMMAQRWNPVAFLVSYCFTAFCWFTSAFIGAAWATGVYTARDEWKSILAILAPILLSLCQLIPPYVDKTSEELYMTPRPFPFMKINFASGHGRFVPHLFPSIDYLTSMIIHYFFLGTGLTFAWAVMISFLNGQLYFYTITKLSVLLPLVAIAAALITALIQLVDPQKQIFMICIYGIVNMSVAGVLAAAVNQTNF